MKNTNLILTIALLVAVIATCIKSTINNNKLEDLCKQNNQARTEMLSELNELNKVTQQIKKTLY